MYTPRSFREGDAQVIRDLISRYSFGILISCGERGLQATHVPFEIITDEGGSDALMCHVARANPHWRDFQSGGTALVCFVGPHTYVSPAWYAEPYAVPTWNYAAVHVRGPARLVHDTDALRAHVIRLSRQYESTLESGWDVVAMVSRFEHELRAIVGIVIPMEVVEAKFKFNQNRSRRDQEGVAAALRGSPDPMQREVAEIMERNLRRGSLR